jgi:hypothetical protein
MHVSADNQQTNNQPTNHVLFDDDDDDDDGVCRYLADSNKPLFPVPRN